TLEVDTGNDALGVRQVQDVNDDWIDITADGTTVQGQYGELSVDLDGSWTYTLSDNTLDHDGDDLTGADDQVQDAFQVRATDDEGDVSPEATLTVDINDDGPKFTSVSDAIVAGVAGAEVSGSYVASFGADNLEQLGLVLQQTGMLSGQDITFDVGDQDANGVSSVVARSASGSELFTFFIKTQNNPVSEGGDGSVTFKAFSDEGDMDGSLAFEIFVDEGGEYKFNLQDNSFVTAAVASGADFGAFGPVTSVANDDQSLVITGNDEVNASSNGVGVKQPTISKNDFLELGFSLQQTEVAFDLVQWGGSGAASIDFTVDGSSFVSSGIAEIEKDASSVSFVVDSGKAGTYELNGDGSSYTFYVADKFSKIGINHEGGAKFGINNVSYDKNFEIQDLIMNYQLSAIDGDGDEAIADDLLSVAIASYLPENFESGQVLSGDAGSNQLVGTDDGDYLYGSGGDDDLMGGAGDDILWGGDGNDVFKWDLGDEADSGQPAAEDIIADFSNGDNVLDLADILLDDDPTNLGDYIFAEQDGDDTVLHIDTSGSINAGGGNADQRITLEDFTTGETDSSAILAQMLNDDQLKIDQ
ncbi:type I secretion C-terminal target domain-containing protein, partial [Halomonas urumqiensis]